MGSHAPALRLWLRAACAVGHRGRGARGYLCSSSSLSSFEAGASTSRALSSCGRSVGQMGLSRRILGFEVFRVSESGFRWEGRSGIEWGAFRRASTVATEDSKPAEDVAEGITLTENCVRRIQEIKREDGPEGDSKMLRLSVEGGGCSGFMYNFALDDKVNKDDRVFERDGAKLVVDDISFGFIKGATVDFTEELIRASFAVTINPNASSACGCGASFNAK